MRIISAGFSYKAQKTNQSSKQVATPTFNGVNFEYRNPAELASCTNKDIKALKSFLSSLYKKTGFGRAIDKLPEDVEFNITPNEFVPHTFDVAITKPYDSTLPWKYLKTQINAAVSSDKKQAKWLAQDLTDTVELHSGMRHKQLEPSPV